MFCPECGAEQLTKDPKFCLSCGAPLAARKEGAPQEPAETTPTAQAAAPSEAPGRSNGRAIALVAAIAGIVAAVAIALAIVIPRILAPTSTGSDPQATPPEQPQPKAAELGREAFVGTWVAQDSTDPNMPKGYFEDRAALGLYATLTLDEDGTGTFKTEDDSVDVTWEDVGDAQGQVHAGGDPMPISLDDADHLTMKNAAGVQMYFVTSRNVDMSNAADATGTGTTGQAPQQGMRRIGNPSVGYLQVPDSWTDRSADLDPNLLDGYDAVYYADPATEFTSAVQAHFAFAKSVQLNAYQTSYKAVSSQVAATYQGKEYGELTTSDMTLGGRKAVMLVCSVPDDNLNVATIVIDRDGDEKNAVALILNCGPSDTQPPSTEVLRYASTWEAS